MKNKKTIASSSQQLHCKCIFAGCYVSLKGPEMYCNQPAPPNKNKTKQDGLVRLSDEAEDDVALLTIFNRVEKVRTVSTIIRLEHIQQTFSPDH